MPPKLPKIGSPFQPIRGALSEAHKRIEEARSGIRTIADDLHSFVPRTVFSSVSDQEVDLKETKLDGFKFPTTVREHNVERKVERTREVVAAAEPKSPSEEKPGEKIATGCLPCAVGHFSTSSGLLKEALRFKGEGMTSNEILDRIATALEEQNSLEREDLSPEKIRSLTKWEEPIAEEALEQSRQLRHRLESIKTIDELKEVAADTRTYYLKLSRQWYKGRFGNLGAKKAEAIAQRVGGAL